MRNLLCGKSVRRGLSAACVMLAWAMVPGETQAQMCEAAGGAAAAGGGGAAAAGAPAIGGAIGGAGGIGAAQAAGFGQFAVMAEQMERARRQAMLQRLRLQIRARQQALLQMAASRESRAVPAVDPSERQRMSRRERFLILGRERRRQREEQREADREQRQAERQQRRSGGSA